MQSATSIFTCAGVAALTTMAMSGCQMYDDDTVAHFYGARTSAASSPSTSSTEKKELPKKELEPKPIVPGTFNGAEGSKETKGGKGSEGSKGSKDKDIPVQASHPYQPPHPANPGYPSQPGPSPVPGIPYPSDEPGSVVGDSCAPGTNICLGLKYVVYQDATGDPIETDRDAIDNVRDVNSLWRDCGIQFQIERYVPIDPASENLRYRTAHHSELNQIRRKFMDDRTLLVVMTGAWDRSGSLGNTWANAWTNLPGEKVYGSVLERSVSKNPGILAHELGHYLSLDHVSDQSDLMNPIIYRTSTQLRPGQCESARWAAKYFWSKMTRESEDR
jgi:hypothetical protein